MAVRLRYWPWELFTCSRLWVDEFLFGLDTCSVLLLLHCSLRASYCTFCV